MTVAAYVRVSSLKGQKTDAQRSELERWAKRQRFKNVQWFEDRETGKHLERPAFQKMQAAIFSGSIDAVMVWKLDRLARNLKDGINTVADWCQRGIRVISITQQIDLNGPVGQLIAGVLFGIAQIEHQHIRERQAIGIAAAKKKGVYTGRKVGTTKAQPARASALRKQGLTVPEIAQALGVKHRTVFNYLRKSR
jgi:DNA invertase Pin-like site-specific DNA recombinase